MSPVDVEAGYEPDRVRQLVVRTRAAIDALAAISSSDPVAGGAMRAVRLARRNLEDQWMTALHDIERSEAMVDWQASRLEVLVSGSRIADESGSGASAEHVPVGIPSRWRDELLGELVARERRALVGADEVNDDGAVALARRMAFWVRHDAGLAAQLVELSASNLVIGRLLGLAPFPPPFVADVVRRMAAPNGPDTGVDHDRYAGSLDAALAALIDHPTACLDLLLDEPTAYALATWGALDPDVVAAFVTSGLYDGVAIAPGRLDDGYRVLGFLTRATGGPLDDGMAAGVALGVSAALAGYVDTLAPAIRQEGSTPVVIRSVDPPLDLGTYDELVGLFAALLRTPEAEVAIGTVLAGYTIDIAERLGTDVTSRPELQYLARFADLVGDATRHGHARLAAAAAAAESRHRRIGDMIGFGANVALRAGGAGSIARAVSSQAIGFAIDRLALPEPPAHASDVTVPAATYDLVTVAVVGAVAADPSRRRATRFRGVTTAQWTEARRRVEAILRVTDPDRRRRAVGELDHWIETGVPALATYLVEVRSIPGMEELTEARGAVGSAG